MQTSILSISIFFSLTPSLFHCHFPSLSLSLFLSLLIGAKRSQKEKKPLTGGLPYSLEIMLPSLATIYDDRRERDKNIFVVSTTSTSQPHRSQICSPSTPALLPEPLVPPLHPHPNQATHPPHQPFLPPPDSISPI